MVVSGAFLIGATAHELKKVFDEQGVPAGSFPLLQGAVAASAKAAVAARADAVVLFSPGFASFDMFSGYAERGARFEQCVAQVEI